MVELLLMLAQSVLGPVIVDLVTGRTAAVRKREIEVAIATAARERHAFTNDQLDQIVRHTMEEVLCLVERNPDLDWRAQKVRLARQVAKEDISERRDEVVTERLRRLADLVEQRRKDLGLPLFVESGASPAGQRRPVPSQGVVWEHPEAVAPDDAESPEKELWMRELEGMKSRVARRRAQTKKSNGDM